MGQRIAAGTPVLTLTFCLVVLSFPPSRLLAADEDNSEKRVRSVPELTQAAPRRINGVPNARFAKLRRGVNTSHWFAQVVDPKGYTPEHFLTHTTIDDVVLIKSLGFDHVRLSVDPAPMFVPGQADKIPRDYLDHLDRAIRMILVHDLALIVDIHPSSDFKKKLQTDDRHVEAFADFWRALARHLSTHDSERVFLEVLNEPEFGDGYRWSGVQAKLVATIRSAAPQHTIIVTGHRWSALDELLLLEPLRDPNAVYNFHFYTPHLFTHQGATWGVNFWHYLAGIPYPSSPETISTVAGSIPDELPRLHLMRYGQDRWSASRIEMEIVEVARWARKHHVRITCNEFGVYRHFANPVDRAAWIADVRTVLERHGIGWTVWDYAGTFGIVTKRAGATLVDEGIVRALGLRGTPVSEVIK